MLDVTLHIHINKSVAEMKKITIKKGQKEDIQTQRGRGKMNKEQNRGGFQLNRTFNFKKDLRT